ncbi:hypothetical protein IZ6_28970 [Terrihabitans soli]|uniref:Uncharacterized protein n=2 Tax=Terrihabitans soli TaxID=708113 RepID=A0A6S6QY07_9HYPH|nr:hypothetical protein IZ6_28970 [Terrihabitans soli]
MPRILAASAHAELHPNPYFLRIDNKAQHYADECRFGHTFRGSFGFTIESPVGPNTITPAEDEQSALPLERRAIARLARGLRSVEAAVREEAPEIIVGSYSSGFNANACDELAAFLEMPHLTEVAFEILFSPEWGAPPDLGPNPMVQISQSRGADVIRRAAKALRIVNYEKQRTIVGKVRTLHSMETPSDLFSISGLQDVIVEWDSDEFGKRNIRVSLGPEEYLQAVQAHTAGRLVSITGELEQGRPWRLENATNFTVLT